MAVVLEPPARSVVQRMEALAKGNDVRSARAQLKRDIKAGRVLFADLVVNPPAYLLTAKVGDILMAAPRVGRVKAGEVLRKCRISPRKTFEGLSGRQRAELASMTRRYRDPAINVRAGSTWDRMAHLQRANVIRLSRSALKQELAEGTITPGDILAEVPPEAESWPIGEMLDCQRRWGPVISDRFLSRLEISSSKPIGALTTRQRVLITARLGA